MAEEGRYEVYGMSRRKDAGFFAALIDIRS